MILIAFRFSKVIISFEQFTRNPYKRNYLDWWLEISIKELFRPHADRNMLGIVEARSTGSPNEVQILIFILNCKTVAFMVNPRNFKTSKSKGEKYNGRAYSKHNFPFALFVLFSIGKPIF